MYAKPCKWRSFWAGSGGLAISLHRLAVQAKRRGLATADWPALTVAVPIGSDEDASPEPATHDEEGA